MLIHQRIRGRLSARSLARFQMILCQTENSLRLLHFYVEFDEIKYKNLSCRVKKYIDATREALYCIDAR